MNVHLEVSVGIRVLGLEGSHEGLGTGGGKEDVGDRQVAMMRINNFFVALALIISFLD